MLDGNMVQMLRKRRGITQQAMSDALKIERPYLSALENGKMGPSMLLLTAIGHHLRVPIALLIHDPALKLANYQHLRLAIDAARGKALR